MKKIFTFLSIVGALSLGSVSYGQSFTTAHDTMYVNTNTNVSVDNNLNIMGSAPVGIQWRVISSDLPSGWMGTVGICDNATCYGSADVWPTAMKSTTYSPGAGVFEITMDLTSFAADGPYVMKVKLNNAADLNDTVIQTYIVTRTATTSSASMTKSASAISLYPNPATNVLNVVYNTGSDVKNIAVYNIIGRQMNMFRVTDNNSASLNIESIPSGIYFVRLMNSRGDVVTTRKFTKQ